MKKSVYQRIMRADERGTGLRLTREDVSELAADTAIRDAAEADDDDPTAERVQRWLPPTKEQS